MYPAFSIAQPTLLPCHQPPSADQDMPQTPPRLTDMGYAHGEVTDFLLTLAGGSLNNQKITIGEQVKLPTTEASRFECQGGPPFKPETSA